MDRGWPSHLLSWLLVPAVALLVASALSLPLRAYTGLVPRGDVIENVLPGSPGARAGIRSGDRFAPELGGDPLSRTRGPLDAARPGRPLSLTLEREGVQRRVWLAPEPSTAADRRIRVGQLLVAAGFVLLGGWVWSERRDTLTRVFLLLCLSFALVIVPPPLLIPGRLTLLHELALTAAQLFLPALFVHFFALFPESRGPRGALGTLVSAGYGVATLLFVAAVALEGVRLARPSAGQDALDALHMSAGAWFVIGLVSALALFARSYLRAGSPDARRRLRVVLLGTALGVGPLAALVALRNLAPGVALPGERWSALLTLLVPASFAWAIAVHRIFDFRIALRAVLGALVVAAVSGLAYALGQRFAAPGWSNLSGSMAGAALALVTAALLVAGPLRRRLRVLSVTGGGVPPLAEWSGRHGFGHDDPDEILSSACDALCAALRLDGTAALVPSRGEGLVAASSGRPPAVLLERLPQELPSGRVAALEDAPLEPADRTALEDAGARWILPVGESPTRALFVLGRRLAGSWLDRDELAELQRFAARIELALENALLRRDASTHGRLDRSLREAGAIQAHRLPRHAPVYPTLDCSAAALSTEPVGGDYYDFVEGPSRDFTLAVGDAAGHGVPAALVMADVQARFRSAAQHGQPPAEVLAALNHELVRHGEPEHFVGLLVARVEAREGRVSIANAGITPPVLRRREGAFEQVTAGGVLLGVREGADYPEVGLQLAAGDLLLIHTDGLSEARRGEEMFGDERVRRVLDAHAHRRAADVVQALLEAVREFADAPLDDITVLVLRQLTDPAGTSLRASANSPLKSTEALADSDG